MTNRKKLLFAGIVCVLLVVAIVILLLPKTQLTLAIAPSPVNLQIDDKSIKRVANGDKVQVSAGTHTITVSETDFTSYKTTITIKKGETKELLVALTANSDAAQQRLNSDEAQAIVQRFNGNKITTQTDDATKNYPLLKVLPIEARLYRIYPCDSLLSPNDPSKVGICVDSNTATADIKPFVEKDISDRGYNPSQYEIIYTSDLSTGD